MTRLRARAVLIAGVMAWPAFGTALARSARVTVPALLEGRATLDDGLAAVAALGGLVILGWLAVATVSSAVEAAISAGPWSRGRQLTAVARASSLLSSAVTPAALRRLVTVAVAGALVTSVAPAQAATVAETRSGVVAAVPLDPGWGVRSSRTTSRAPTTAPAVTSAPALDPSWGGPGRIRLNAQPEVAVVVRRGDSLWDIAARHLGPSATDAEIALAWPRWYAANRVTIGPDPDRLTPGQRLHPPASRAGGPS